MDFSQRLLPILNGGQTVYEQRLFDIKQLNTYNPNNVGLGRKFNKYSYEYGSDSNESIFSQVIPLPFDKSQFFT